MAILIDPKIWFDISSGKPPELRVMLIDVLSAGDILQERGPVNSELLAEMLDCDDDCLKQAVKLLADAGMIASERTLTGFAVVFPDSPIGDLKEWLEWWNRLKSEELVNSGYRTGKISSGVKQAWKRVQRSAELMELLARRTEIEERIRASDFCREKWFSIEKLFGAKNKSGCYIVEELLRGAYEQRNGKRRISASKVFG